MGLSFQEKSLWLMFVSLVGCFGFYFVNVLRAQPSVEEMVPTLAADVMPHQAALFLVATALLVACQIVGHLLIVLVDRRVETDERDRLIALKGTRNASYVLATGAFCTLSTAMVTNGNFACAHVLLGFWVLAQLVEIGTQLVLYRRGA